MRPSRLLSSRRTSVWLYLLGLGLLLAAWVFGNPPGSAADEGSHYVRALGAAAGDITGHPAAAQTSPNASAAQNANLNDYVRNYPVPANLTPASLGCDASLQYTSASCVSTGDVASPAGEVPSQHAGQPPLPYLLAGPAMLYQKNVERADWAGRSTLALFCLLLIAVPLAMAGRYRGRCLVGLTVALTPMAIFTGSILNPSGIEIFSSVGFFLSLVALAEGRHPGGALFAAAFTGVFVTMSRPFAPLWIVAGLIAATGLVGPATLWRGIVRRPWGSGRTAILIALGAVSTLAFLKLYPSPVTTNVAHFDFVQFKLIAEGSVGDFGWLDTPLPIHVADWWLQLVVVLTALALIFGNWWERLTVALMTAISIGATWFITVHFLLPVNIGPQGRHFLPLLVLQPLTTSMVLARQRLAIRLISVGVPVILMLGLQFVGWVVNGTRQGLGLPATTLSAIPHDVHALLGPSYWSPPGGFKAWYVVLIVGCALLLIASVQALVVPVVVAVTASADVAVVADEVVAGLSSVGAGAVADEVIDAQLLEPLFPDWPAEPVASPAFGPTSIPPLWVPPVPEPAPVTAHGPATVPTLRAARVAEPLGTALELLVIPVVSGQASAPVVLPMAPPAEAVPTTDITEDASAEASSPASEAEPAAEVAAEPEPPTIVAPQPDAAEPAAPQPDPAEPTAPAAVPVVVVQSSPVGWPALTGVDMSAIERLRRPQ